MLDPPTLALALLGAALPPGSSPADWIALPTPSLCEPRMTGSHPGPLSSGSHILSRNDGLPLPGSQPTPRLSVSTLLKIVEDDARAKSTRIEFFRSASGLLARGDPAAIDAARARIAEIERAAETLTIDLEIDLVGLVGLAGRAGPAPGGNGGGTKPGSAPPERFSAKSSVGSGEEAFLGLREATPFVMSFDVEVAADSGIAAPVLGTATHGRTLHLRAARIEGGRRVHLEGLLDLADLAALERFDPESPDLGTLQEPRIDFVQVAFAGVVEPGGTLEVEIAGAPLALPSWKLSIRAITRADAGGGGGASGTAGGPGRAVGEASAATQDDAFDVIDLSFLASESTSIPDAGPGAELDRQAFFVQPRRTTIPIPPSAVAATLELRAGDGAGLRPTPAWSDDLLILPRSDAAGRAEARALIAAAEKARISTVRIEARRGGLVARFPACSGSPARLLAGRERTALVGYRAEIAPQTWMPAPTVERSFDGLSLAIEVQSGGAECSAWIAGSSGEEVVARQDAQLGRLQILRRNLRAERAVVRPGEPERTLASGGASSSDPVFVRVAAP